jgi:ABC-type multidrug transport system permease subunit
MGNIQGTILTFQPERPVFLREQANKMYSVGTYYLAKTLIETPVLLLSPMVFTLIVYFGIGLTVTGFQFGFFYLILVLVT